MKSTSNFTTLQARQPARIISASLIALHRMIPSERVKSLSTKKGTPGKPCAMQTYAGPVGRRCPQATGVNPGA